MGIMPADRELKWQRVFRRFGLPRDVSEKDDATDSPGDRLRREDPLPDKARGSKPAQKK